jgi:hypothetical protein
MGPVDFLDFAITMPGSVRSFFSPGSLAFGFERLMTAKHLMILVGRLSRRRQEFAFGAKNCLDEML